MSGEPGFFYLNSGNEWPSFQLDRVTNVPGGTLVLAGTPAARSPRGAFLSGPFAAPLETEWFRVRLEADPLDTGTHLQLFLYTADSGSPAFASGSFDPFSDPDWNRAPRDVLDVLLPPPTKDATKPGRNLWVGGLLRGDGSSTPAVHQIRIEYGRDTYRKYLPEIYGEDDASRDFLERLLALEKSVLGALDDTITDLPRLFDPRVAPSAGFPSWLSWLAGWLAFELNEHWSEEDTRAFVARAFALYGRRGTLAGLREYVKMYAGVEALIEEPGAATNLWRLDGTATLGMTTMLAPGHWQGAVLDSTATLDRSYLMRSDACGDALFEDLAHRFCVRVFCGELTRPGALDDVRAVLDREKPAHTVYHLRVIEPAMRVGSQARVGIESIVADKPPAARLGGRLDTGVLRAASQRCSPVEGN